MKFNPTNYHFYEKKPDRVTYSGDKIPVPPQFKTPLWPNKWDDNQPIRYGTYADFIPTFRTMPRNFRLFLDTGFITSHEIPQELWDCILEKKVFITTHVWKELQPWVKSPKCNQSFRDCLVDAIKLEEAGTGHPAISLASLNDLAADITPVAIYYASLLWLRKHFALQRYDRFIEENGREPSPAEIQAICQKIAGSRGWRLAKKELDERGKPSEATDEITVVSAVFHSILFGQPTLILTRDNDVFEQFYKAIYLIDSHYHGMLMAEKFKANPSAFRAMPAPAVEGLYIGEGNLLVEMTDGTHHPDLRPNNLFAVQCTCGILSTGTNPLTYSDKTFGISNDMHRILRMKAATRGRNTDLFGTMNFHVQLDPRGQIFKMRGPALINDKYLQCDSSEVIPISTNDGDLAIFTNEQYAQEVFQYE